MTANNDDNKGFAGLMDMVSDPDAKPAANDKTADLSAAANSQPSAAAAATSQPDAAAATNPASANKQPDTKAATVKPQTAAKQEADSGSKAFVITIIVLCVLFFFLGVI